MCVLCTYVFILPENSLLLFIPLTFSARHRVWRQWCHLSVLCVCACILSFRRREYIMQIRENEGKNRREWQWAEGRRRGRSGMEMILCLCVTAAQHIFVCLSVCPRAAKSAINLTPSCQNECVVVWHCVCELWSGWYHQFLYWKRTGKLQPFKLLFCVQGWRENWQHFWNVPRMLKSAVVLVPLTITDKL